MVTFSDQALRAMGFRPFDQSEELRARFFEVHIYALEGLSLQSLEIFRSRHGTAEYQVALGPEVNSASQALLQTKYTSNAEAWKKERKWRGPYAVIVIGPSSEHCATKGHLEEMSDGSIHTMDLFREAKEELAQSSLPILSKVVTALLLRLRPANGGLRIRAIEKSVLGKTSDGRWLHDVQMRANLQVVVSTPVDEVDLRIRSAAAWVDVNRLDDKVARLFFAAHSEVDALKRFLYFFHALEVLTHSTFASIDHSGKFAALIPVTSLSESSGKRLLQKQADHMRNLRDRFAWCALWSWPDITDADVATFLELKEIRDKLSHGSLEVPPASKTLALELLASKLLVQKPA